MKRPGSAEGMREASHWGWENARPTVVQRAFMKEQAAVHLPDRGERAAFNKWLGAPSTTRHKVERVCKAWGVQLPHH